MAKKARRKTAPGPSVSTRRGGAREASSPGATSRSPKGGRRPSQGSPAARSDWVSDQLAEILALADNYHEDFIKSRKADCNSRIVRNRISKQLDDYAKRVDRLRKQLRNPPDTAIPHMGRIAPGSPVDITWTLTEAVAACLDGIHTALERQRSQIAAPMSEQQKDAFWNGVKKLATAMERLRSLVEELQKLIAAEKTTEDDPELKALDTACKRLCEAIGHFGRRYARFSRSRDTDRTREIQAAVTEYSKALTKVGDDVEQVFPNVAEKYRALRVAEDPLAARVDQVQSRLGFQFLLIDAVCEADARRVALPQEADEQTFKLRELVNPILRTNRQIAEKLRTRSNAAEECCDTVPESDLPEYSALSPTPSEQEQFRVIVDSLLLLQAKHGPEASTTRKKLVAVASELADHRGVPGMGQTNVFNKLNKLVDLHIVRKIEATKSQYNQNASHAYRLGLPAQARYSSHVQAVRDEFTVISERRRGSSADD